MFRKRCVREVILNLGGNEIICKEKKQMLKKTAKNFQNTTELERV
jgi:hypothetical protein